VADLGLVQDDARATTVLTTASQTLGTYFYAAPEVWAPGQDVGIAADVYSLGKILQFLVEGGVPSGPPAPGPFHNVIERATRQRPNARYSSAVAFLDATEHAAAAGKRDWESPEDKTKRLSGQVRRPDPDPEALKELLEWSGVTGDDEFAELKHTIPRISTGGIRWLWKHDQEALRQMVDRLSRLVAEGRTKWEWAFCDVISDFFERAYVETADSDILRAAMHCLPHLGASHNRWHVQDVVLDLLRRVRTEEAALAAVDGLASAHRADVEWTIGKVARRSMHPVIARFLARFD
jgi:hypothetical protein